MSQWSEIHRRPDLPMHAGATDIANNVPVKLAASGSNWAVIPVQSSADHPIGMTRASAPANKGIAVRDRGEIVRVNAGATVVSGEYVGVASVTATAGASGNIQIPIIAPVARASGSAVWAIGQALEHANPGSIFAFLVDPTQISGLA